MSRHDDERTADMSRTVVDQISRSTGHDEVKVPVTIRSYDMILKRVYQAGRQTHKQIRAASWKFAGSSISCRYEIGLGIS
jgi:hypothetical protein